MELHQLRYMMAVAKYQSFTQAAEEINISQSSLSTQISKLEAELGTKLFERGARLITLTRAGEEFLPFASEICDKEATSREHMKMFTAPDRGVIKFGVFPGTERYDFFPRLSEFAKRFPNISLDFYEAEGTVLVDMLKNNEITCAFCCAPDVCGDVKFFHLYTDEMVLIAPPDHKYAERGEISLEMLRGETFIFSEIGSLYTTVLGCVMNSLNNTGGDDGITLLKTHGTSLLTNMGMVAAGFGLSMCSEKAAKNYSAIGYRTLKLAPPIPRIFGIAVAQGNLSQPLVKNFINFICDFCK